MSLPPPTGLPSSCLPLDNWKLDKLVLSLSANKATWRRSLLLFEWLKAAGHQLDDRLCTTVSAHTGLGGGGGQKHVGLPTDDFVACFRRSVPCLVF